MTNMAAEMLELVELAGSQRKAATAAGINQATVSRMCSGLTDEASIKMNTVTKVRAALAKLRRRAKTGK